MIDLDASIVICHSEKEQAAPTFKKTFGYHPMLAFCDNTGEFLAAQLRRGNAGSNTAADHIAVLDAALAQLPDAHRHGTPILVRADTAGCTREFLAHLRSLRGAAVSCEFSVGWAVTDRERGAITAIPMTVWSDAIDADGGHRDGAGLAEITGVLPGRSLAGYPAGTRVVVRRERPHPGAQLDAFEERDGWRYTAFATDTRVGQLARLDARHRAHARVEDRIRCAKDTGLDHFPSRTFAINSAWLAVVMLAVDLLAWAQHLLLRGDLARAEPKTLRYRLLHVAARLTRGQRRLWIRIQRSWPWARDLAAAGRADPDGGGGRRVSELGGSRCTNGYRCHSQLRIVWQQSASQTRSIPPSGWTRERRKEATVPESRLSGALPQFDPHDPGLSPERAYATYAELREQCPVARGEHYGGYWSISRYSDVRDVATDHATYSSTGGVYLPPVSESRFPPIDHDPPEHAGFRELIAPLTSGAAAKRMEPKVRAIADRLVDGFAGRGRAELASELATPLPLDVITQLYDLGPEHTEEIRGYSEEFLTHASGPRGREIIERVCRYWVALFADRRENPREDFLTGLLDANRELGATDDELANMMFILTYAGHDSTALGLSNTLLYLAEHPDVQQRLLDEPKLVPSMIDEILRYETPLHWFPRRLTADTCLHGQRMRAGERVLLLFASANRDPEVFERADEIVIDRRPNRHLAFGAGIHTCPGMALAKLEIRTAVQVVLERIPGFRVDGDVERTDPLEGGGRHLGVRRLPVAW